MSKAAEIFEELISTLDEKKKKYVRCKINEYNRTCMELFYKKVFHFPRIIDLVLEDYFSRIEEHLETEKQKTFLRNVMVATRNQYVNCYVLMKKINKTIERAKL